MEHSDKMNLSELCEKKAIEQVYVQRVENLWRLRFILQYFTSNGTSIARTYYGCYRATLKN